jgi:hypothetical protein
MGGDLHLGQVRHTRAGYMTAGAPPTPGSALAFNEPVRAAVTPGRMDARPSVDASRIRYGGTMDEPQSVGQPPPAAHLWADPAFNAVVPAPHAAMGLAEALTRWEGEGGAIVATDPSYERPVSDAIPRESRASPQEASS